MKFLTKLKQKIFNWIWDHSRFLFEIAQEDDDLWEYFYDNMDRDYVREIVR